MNTVIFVEEYPDALQPLSLTTPTFELRYGARQLYRSIVEAAGEPDVIVAPPRFRRYLSERYPGKGLELEGVSGIAVALNASIRPSALAKALELLRSGGGPVVDGGRLVAARLEVSSVSSRELMERRDWNGVEADALVKGPWELVEALGSWGREGPGDVVYGSNVQVEEPVAIDASRGPVLIADDVKLEAFTRIEGPAYVGKGSIIHSARINGHTYIGERCKVGGEVEHSIMAGYSNKAHHGYLGHSYVGQWVNIGAGAVTSDLKNTYGTVRVGPSRVDTGAVKVGSFIADHVKVSIGSLIYAGRTIGAASHVYGLVHEDVPPFTVYSSLESPATGELPLDKALEIARRMMARRGVEITDGVKDIMRGAYALSHGSRPHPP